MAARQERLEGQPAGDRVLGVADELAVALADGADLPKERRVGVDVIEQVAAGMEKVHLVRRYERSQRVLV